MGQAFCCDNSAVQKPDQVSSQVRSKALSAQLFAEKTIEDIAMIFSQQLVIQQSQGLKEIEKAQKIVQDFLQPRNDGCDEARSFIRKMPLGRYHANFTYGEMACELIAILSQICSRNAQGKYHRLNQLISLTKYAEKNDAAPAPQKDRKKHARLFSPVSKKRSSKGDFYQSEEEENNLSDCEDYLKDRGQQLSTQTLQKLKSQVQQELQCQATYQVVFLKNHSKQMLSLLKFYDQPQHRGFFGILCSLISALLETFFINEKLLKVFMSFFSECIVKYPEPPDKTYTLSNEDKNKLRQILQILDLPIETIINETRKAYHKRSLATLDINVVIRLLLEETQLYVMPQILTAELKQLNGLTDALGQIHINSSFIDVKSDENYGQLLHLLCHEFGHRLRVTALNFYKNKRKKTTDKQKQQIEQQQQQEYLSPQPRNKKYLTPLQFTPPRLTGESGIFLHACLLGDEKKAFNYQSQDQTKKSNHPLKEYQQLFSLLSEDTKNSQDLTQIINKRIKIIQCMKELMNKNVALYSMMFSHSPKKKGAAKQGICLNSGCAIFIYQPVQPQQVQDENEDSDDGKQRYEIFV